MDGVQPEWFEGDSQKNILTSKPIVINLKRRYYRDGDFLDRGVAHQSYKGQPIVEPHRGMS